MNIKTIPILATLLLFGCTTTQREHARTILSTPQARAIESAGTVIAQAALAVYAPEFAWTLPLAVNAASGLLTDKNNTEIVATVQQMVAQVSNIPAYKPVATQIGNAIAAVAPVNDEQRMAATQALAKAIADNLPKS